MVFVKSLPSFSLSVTPVLCNARRLFVYDQCVIAAFCWIWLYRWAKDEGKLPFKAGENHVYGMLEYAKCVTKFEWHTKKRLRLWWNVNAVLSLSPWSISICQFPLLASIASKDGCFAERFYAFVHPWYRVCVPISYCVKFLIVDTKSESSVFRRDEYYWCCPSRLYGLDEILGEHHVNFWFFKFARFRTSSVWYLMYWRSVRF